MTQPEKSQSYAAQARSDYDRYFEGMEKTVRQKLAVIAAHFLPRPGAVIADMGCGSGLGSFCLAQANPGVQVVGIDINPDSIKRAKEKYKLPNLTFVEGNVESPDPSLGPFDGILNSSVLHHVHTFNGYDSDHVVNTLKNHMACLKQGGVMVVRDFCAEPDDQFVLLDLQAEGEGYTPDTMSDADLLVLFSENACALKEKRDRGFFIEEQAVAPLGYRRFRLSAKWAAEFLLRKDYRADWETEVQEEYAWWTPDDFRRILSGLGGRVTYASPYWNPWILANRFRGKVKIFNENGAPRNFPATNFVAVVEKTAEGASLHLSERAVAKSPKSYLKFAGWKNTESGEVLDMAARPGDVTDCLPYAVDENDRLLVYARHGYPRPIANTVSRSTPVLDQKHWSGHMVEPVAVADANADTLAAKLAERSGLKPAQFENLEAGLKYYPSPGMTDEIVSSVFTKVAAEDMNHSFAVASAVSGFSASGEVRLFDADDLLGASQVGLLPEARLEMNIYALFRKLKRAPGPWIGAEITRPHPADPQVANLESLLAHREEKLFAPSDKPADYLQCLRSVFSDRSGETELASNDLEFVLPAKLSANVVLAAPLAAAEDGEVCIGLERRHLPGPQAREGGSSILVVPAFRLPAAVATAEKAAEYVAAKFLQQRRCVSKLGEGYFSSIGMTPERVFPYAVVLEPGTDVYQLSEELEFVPLRQIFGNLEELRDAHLLIAALRAIHALGLWEDFTAV